MKPKLRIKEAAKERGFTLSAIAKKIGIARSNMSAIASGSRGVSLKNLRAISDIIGCGLDELVVSRKEGLVFNDPAAQAQLEAIEEQNYDGIDKSWVDTLMVANIAHRRAIRKAQQ